MSIQDFSSEARWPAPARRYIDAINQLLSGKISAKEYRDIVCDPATGEGERYAENNPAYPITSQLLNDANEFIPDAEYRDHEDMSEEELRIRAGFACDALKVLVWYWEDINKK